VLALALQQCVDPVVERSAGGGGGGCRCGHPGHLGDVVNGLRSACRNARYQNGRTTAGTAGTVPVERADNEWTIICVALRAELSGRRQGLWKQ
jgi:hypothetical protein